MAEQKIQEYLFQQVKERLPAGASLADTIADALNISQDSAYRRIRNETPLVLEEAKLLCEQFQLSLDQLFRLSASSVVFENVDVNGKANSFKGFLSGILKHLQYLASFKEKQIIYLATDITVFHYFIYKPVFAFRYFFWMQSVLQHPDFQQQKFSVDGLPADVYETGQEILSLYETIPSVEIWNARAVNSFLLQVSHYRDTGLITDTAALEIYTALRQTLTHVRLQAEHGKKFLPGKMPHIKKENYTLLHNRSSLGDNCILVLHDDKRTAYLNYDVLNYMMTRDENFCESVHDNLQLIMRKSTLISSVSEKQRSLFFKTLTAKIPNRDNLNQPSL